MKTIQEIIKVMQHFANGGEVECRTARDWFTAPNPSWNWGSADYRIKQPVDPYAELKAAAKDPTKQIRCKYLGDWCEWHDATYGWKWCYPPENYEIRDKPKPLKKVKLLAWLVMGQLLLIEDGRTCIGKRMPGQDIEGEVEE